MSLFADCSRTVRRGLPAFLLVAAFGLSGCGGGDEDSASVGGGAATEEVADAQPTDESFDSEDSQGADAPDPVAVLPHEVEVPSGFRMLPASCDPGGPNDPDRPKGEIGQPEETDDDGDPKYSSWITYAVPEGWTAAGRGSAGSGGLTGTDEDMSFRTGDSDNTKVKISVDWDSLDFEGTITDSNGDPWETFDYDYSIGDDSTTITYDKVADVEAGDQEAELFYMDPAQAPDHVSQAEYKVRLDAFEIPEVGPDGGYELMTESFVVTVEFDAEEAVLDQEVVERVIESFVLPECSYDYALESAELRLNIDLNGDGHIRDADDVQEELQEMQEEMEARLEEERQNSDDG